MTIDWARQHEHDANPRVRDEARSALRAHYLPTVGDRVLFITSGNIGEVLDTADHLSTYDGDLGPWCRVAFDDGLTCWVTTVDLLVKS